MAEHRRHDDRPWYRDVRFLLPMCLTVAMALGGGFLGSWVASSNRLAALDQIALSLQHSVDELKGQVGSATGTLRTLTGLVGKVQSDGEHNTRDIESLRRQVGDLEREINAWSGKIAKLEVERKTQP